MLLIIASNCNDVKNIRSSDKNIPPIIDNYEQTDLLGNNTYLNLITVHHKRYLRYRINYIYKEFKGNLSEDVMTAIKQGGKWEIQLKIIYEYVYNWTKELSIIPRGPSNDRDESGKLKSKKYHIFLDRYIPYFNKDINIKDELDNITTNSMNKPKNISIESVVIYENYIYSPVLMIQV